MYYIRTVKIHDCPEKSGYPFDIPAIQYLEQGNSLDLQNPVTFFVGENGTGKSTLLEGIAIALGFNAEGGSRDFCFETKSTHSDLYQYLTLVKSTHFPKDGFFLRAESFYNTASYLDMYSREMARYGRVSFHEQSHGESFMALACNRFEGNGIYMLDEPEAALSPEKLMSLLVLIDELVERDSQFVISTHSPILMAYPGAQIYQFSEDGIASVTYKETAHYKITKQFIDQPERMIKYLLER